MEVNLNTYLGAWVLLATVIVVYKLVYFVSLLITVFVWIPVKAPATRLVFGKSWLFAVLWMKNIFDRFVIFFIISKLFVFISSITIKLIITVKFYIINFGTSFRVPIIYWRLYTWHLRTYNKKVGNIDFPSICTYLYCLISGNYLPHTSSRDE